MAEFASVVDAVAAAVEIQRRIDANSEALGTHDQIAGKPPLEFEKLGEHPGLVDRAGGGPARANRPGQDFVWFAPYVDGPPGA